MGNDFCFNVEVADDVTIDKNLRRKFLFETFTDKTATINCR